MNPIRILASIVIIVVIAALALIVLKGSTTAVIQPIPFDHNLHVDEQGLECTLCHVQVMTQEQASLPVNEICGECHSEETTGSEADKKLLGYIAEKREIPWQRIYRVPDHVFFSHRRHTAAGKIGCESCHGDVKKLKKPPRYPLISPTMDNCMNCHEKNNVDNDCLSCHR